MDSIIRFEISINTNEGIGKLTICQTKRIIHRRSKGATSADFNLSRLNILIAKNVAAASISKINMIPPTLAVLPRFSHISHIPSFVKIEVVISPPKVPMTLKGFRNCCGNPSTDSNNAK